MYDPKIGASLQREPSHALNGWSEEPLIMYYRTSDAFMELSDPAVWGETLHE
jgi:hypothetical protein